jgi:glycosyltransferase involved in cell wall biosynthesis
VKVLYVATDQRIPGSTGGSVHVLEVARGLAQRGHEVHVVASPGDQPPAAAALGFHFHPARPWFAHRAFRWSAEGKVSELIERLGVDVVLERYYNFAGEGVRAAHRHGIPSILEVNSPVVDHPGSLKSFLDRYVFFHFMKRLRDRQCDLAAALVTPLPAIIPASVPPSKVHRIHWGANVESFRPGIAPLGPAAGLPIPDRARVVVFSSSFRPWHGAELLVDAAARVLRDPRAECAFFLFLGAGPSLAGARNRARRLDIESRVAFTGAVSYDAMPHYLARAHVGVAPYQPALHGQLRLGFYWSPLKIFEYMASGLPVVTLDIEPLSEIVRSGKEGLLFEEGDVEGLAAVLTELVRSPERAATMGRSARERIVSHYSWAVHCEKLEQVLEEATAGRSRHEASP